MMMSPESFYEIHCKGKSSDQLYAVIRRLKREIGKLKRICEHPEYECAVFPGEATRIACNRLYLEQAYRALDELGEPYVPTAAERRAAALEDNLCHLQRLTFSMGGYFDGYKTYVAEVAEDTVHIRTTHTFADWYPSEEWQQDGQTFLSDLAHLHLGEWRRRYDTRRFGYFICDGFQWKLELVFSDGTKTVKFYGDNAVPYNFEHLLTLVGWTEDPSC